MGGSVSCANGMVKILSYQPLKVSLYDFDMDSATPKAAHLQWIDQLGRETRQKKYPSNTTVYRVISLQGKACNLGREAHNVQLALRRAQSVGPHIENALKGYHHVVVPFSLGQQGNDALSRAVDVVVEELTSVKHTPPPRPVTVTVPRIYAIKKFKIRIVKMDTKAAGVNFRVVHVGGSYLKAAFEIVDLEAQMKAVYAMSQVGGSLGLKDDLMPISASSDQSDESTWVEFTRGIWYPTKNDVNDFDGFRAAFNDGAFYLGTVEQYLGRNALVFDMRKFYPTAEPDRDLKLSGTLSIMGESFDLIRPGWPL